MLYEDRLVQELEEGFVTFRATGERVLKEEYLRNLLEEFKELTQREKSLRKELSAKISPYLREHCPTGDRQECLRRIRWAVEATGLKDVILTYLEDIPRALALHPVEEYQLTDYIFASICAAKGIQLAVVPDEAPDDPAIRWTTSAPDKFAAVENKVQAWMKILRLFADGTPVHLKRFGTRSGQPQQDQLKRIEDKLDEILNCINQQKSTPRTGKNGRK